MDCNWLEGLQSIYQLSNLITLLEPPIFPRSDVLMKRNEASLPAALGLKKSTHFQWLCLNHITHCGCRLIRHGGFMLVFSVLQVMWGQSPQRMACVSVCTHASVCACSECWKRQDHSQTNNPPDPKSQRRTGPDNLTTFTTLSCTMQTVHFMNCRLYLNLVQHLSVICLDMQMSIWTRGFV